MDDRRRDIDQLAAEEILSKRIRGRQELTFIARERIVTELYSRGLGRRLRRAAKNPLVQKIKIPFDRL